MLTHSHIRRTNEQGCGGSSICDGNADVESYLKARFLLVQAHGLKIEPKDSTHSPNFQLLVKAWYFLVVKAPNIRTSRSKEMDWMGMERNGGTGPTPMNCYSAVLVESSKCGWCKYVSRKCLGLR